MDMTEKRIERLGDVFGAMVANYESMNGAWKNIPLGREAFELMRELPDTLEGEFDSPADKADLLCRMLEQMDEHSTPRFCIEVRRHAAELYAKAGVTEAVDDADDSETTHLNAENAEELEQLLDYINSDITMDDYRKKYGKMLRFDPVERTAEWEANVYDADREAAEEMGDEEWRMGMCFAYWSVRKAAFARRGIEWHTPGEMNPAVMFD